MLFNDITCSSEQLFWDFRSKQGENVRPKESHHFNATQTPCSTCLLHSSALESHIDIFCFTISLCCTKRELFARNIKYMAPKRPNAGASAPSRGRAISSKSAQQPSVAQQALQIITDPDNRPLVVAISMFAVSVFPPKFGL